MSGVAGGAVVDCRSLEIWVQSGIPEEGDLVFNVHIRNLATEEWEVSYRLAQFGALDIEINKITDALRDVAFPTINKDALFAIVNNKKSPTKLKDLEHCRMSLEQWVYYVISRIDILPYELRTLIENFFFLPNGPNYVESRINTPVLLTKSSSVVDEYKSPTLADLNSDIHSDVWDDEVSETRTVWTVGSLDENGVPKKKKKRILKGIKKRVGNVFGTNKKPKENFGVDFSGVDGESTPGLPAASKSVVSAVSSTGSDHGKQSVASTSVQQVQPGKLLKVRLSRGGEKSRGVHEYDIQLIYNPEKKPYTVSHVFNDFLALHTALVEAQGIGIASVFPPTHSKSSIGFGLTEDQHAERTRLLDAWIKDGVSTYQYMTDKERALFRAFLGFDLSIPKDIYIHDKMANGMVEAPRAQAPIGTSTTTLPADILPSSKSDSGVSKVSGAPSSISGGNSSRPPIARRANSFAQKIQPPPTNYQVKIVTTGNLSASYVRANTRTKLDLKQMDGTIFTDENSVDSRTNLEYAEGLSDKKRNGSGDSGEYNNKKYPNLSLIHEEDEIDLSRRNTAAIEEDLLRIGMKKENKKPKKSCCCCCS